MKRIGVSIILFFAFILSSTSILAQSSRVDLFEGNGNAEINSVAVDNQNSIISTGFFDGSIDLDPSSALDSKTSTALNDGFLIKTDAQGNYLWGKHYSGPGQIYGNSVSIDQANNIYVTGIFEASINYIDGSISTSLNSLGEFDIFIFKYNPSGTLLWAKQVGDSLKELSPAIQVGKDNFIYLCASFEGTVDFTLNSGISSKTSVGQQDIFILKIDPLGNYEWVKQIEGSDYKYSGGIDSDIHGNVFTTGSFVSAVNFDEGQPAVIKTSNGGTDIFIAKYNNQGNLAWVNQIGSFGFDIGTTLTLDQNSNAYACGSFSGTADFDAGNGTLNLNSNGNRDIYLTKIDSNGSLTWASSVGGTGLDIASGIGLSSTNEILLTGRFTNTIDLDPGSGTSNYTSYGFSDIFFSRYNTSGINLGNAQIGGTANQFGNTISSDNSGNIILGGSITDSAYFVNQSSTSAVLTNTLKDAFIFKLSTSLVGVDSKSTVNFMDHFQNISSNEFELQLNSKQLIQASLLNSNGQLIREFQIRQSETFGNELKSGIYFLILSNGKEAQTLKLIKQ